MAVDELLLLAEKSFPMLSDAEKTMLSKVVRGYMASCGTQLPEEDPSNDPAFADGWGEQRVIRAELIRWLCMNWEASSHVDPRGIRVSQAKIKGELMLSFAKIPFPITLLRCSLMDGCNVSLADLPRFDVSGCRLGVLYAEGASIRGSFFLKNAVCSGYQINLNGIQIGGNLTLNGAQLKGAPDAKTAFAARALTAEAAKIGASVNLLDGFRGEGGVSFYGASVDGSVRCDGAVIEHPPGAGSAPNGPALIFEAATVKGAVLLRWGFAAKGAVNLNFMRIGGNLECTGGTFQNAWDKVFPTSGVALAVEAVKVDGSVLMRADDQGRGIFRAQGGVNMRGIQVGGFMSFVGAQFDHAGTALKGGRGLALNLEAAKVGGAVFLGRNFYARGLVGLYGAEIGGDLDCQGGTFDNPPSNDVEGSGVALDASAAKIGGNLLLRAVDGKPFVARGSVGLFRVRIESNLDCEGGQLTNKARAGLERSGLAMNASGADVGGDVLFRGLFTASGLVNLYNARIGGDVDCAGASFDYLPDSEIPGSGIALNLSGSRVDGSIFLRSFFRGGGRFSAKGAVYLVGTTIEGALRCTESMFENPARANVELSGRAMLAYGLNVKGDVQIDRVSASGVVTLTNARIGGNLDFSWGVFENPLVADASSSGVTIDASTARVSGSVRMQGYGKPDRGFSSKGKVILSGIQIERDLECEGGWFENQREVGFPTALWEFMRGLALQADLLRVSGSVRLSRGFTAKGQVQLAGSHIGGTLDCQRAHFSNRANGDAAEPDFKWPALDATNVTVDRDMQLGDGLECLDKLVLRKSKTGGRLEMQGSTFADLDLGDARASVLVDQVDEAGWDPKAKLNLTGFVYERIARDTDRAVAKAREHVAPQRDRPFNLTKRSKWLLGQTEFSRQPYLQFSKVLKDAGYDREYRRIRMEMESRALEGQNLPRRLWGHILRLTIGYGYASQRAVFWILGLILTGALVYQHGESTMVPTQKDAYEAFTSWDGDMPGYYGSFHPLLYSTDSSFPLIKLGAQEKWMPAEGVHGDRSYPGHARWYRFGWLKSSWFLRGFRFTQVGMGWILTTLFAVGISGVVRKD